MTKLNQKCHVCSIIYALLFLTGRGRAQRKLYIFIYISSIFKYRVPLEVKISPVVEFVPFPQLQEEDNAFEYERYYKKKLITIS